MIAPALDFETLYEVLAGWPTVSVPESAVDGLFERARQILLSASAGGELLPIADLAPILKHIVRRESLQAGTNAQFRVRLGSPWPTGLEWAPFGVGAHSQTDRDQLIEALSWAPTWLSNSDVPSTTPFDRRPCAKTGQRPSIRFWRSLADLRPMSPRGNERLFEVHF
jgi:ATP-dependent DNA helicase RecQ